MQIETCNPSNGLLLKQYPLDNQQWVKKRILKGHEAFLSWRESTLNTRTMCMQKLAEALREAREELALCITQEMGKPIKQSRAEIDKCALLCEYYATNLEAFLRTQEVKTAALRSRIIYQPLGVIFIMMPWNFPFWQVMRAAIPAIAAGNTVLLKHSPNTTGCGEKIVALFKKAKFPMHVLQQIIISNEMTSEVIADRHIAGISFTGSVRTGKIIAQYAGSHMKKCVFELGGNDPYLVLHDADLDWAAQCIVQSRLNNCGQVCIAAKRILVVKQHAEQLLHKILTLIAPYIASSPEDPSCQFGPMAREDLRETLHQQVVKAISQGAILHTGGNIPAGPGFYYPVTVLSNVKPGMTPFEEELFGPVISLIVCDDEEEAIKLANQSQFGLAGAVFTQDLARGEKIASERIQVGVCFVNKIVSSDPRLPFGGIKDSGYGRELSQEGLLEFVNVKTVVVHDPGR